MPTDTLVSEQLALVTRECIPCRGGVAPLNEVQVAPLLAQLQGWSIVDGHHLEKTFTFEDFARALKFVNSVGEVAEKEGHHPDIFLTWGIVRLSLWTHKVDGLTESDFILAAKCDAIRI